MTKRSPILQGLYFSSVCKYKLQNWEYKQVKSLNIKRSSNQTEEWQFLTFLVKNYIDFVRLRSGHHFLDFHCLSSLKFQKSKCSTIHQLQTPCRLESRLQTDIKRLCFDLILIFTVMILSKLTQPFKWLPNESKHLWDIKSNKYWKQ